MEGRLREADLGQREASALQEDDPDPGGEAEIVDGLKHVKPAQVRSGRGCRGGGKRCRALRRDVSGLFLRVHPGVLFSSRHDGWQSLAVAQRIAGKARMATMLATVSRVS